MDNLTIIAKALKIRAVLALFIVFGFSNAVLSQTDKRIEKIRKIYTEVNLKVAECEANGDTSTTFLTELVVNKNDGSYPAVGIYKSVVKFYYTFGDREKDPYPNRLLKITVVTNRSAMTETAEYLFNPAEELIFYFEKKTETENRLYFAAGKLIKALNGDKTVNITNRSEVERAKTAFNEKRKLVGIFQNSLNF